MCALSLHLVAVVLGTAIPVLLEGENHNLHVGISSIRTLAIWAAEATRTPP